MALEYDSDDIGELEDDAEDMIQGPATVQQFDNLLTEFLEDHPTQDHNHEAGYAYDAAGGSVAGGPVDQAAVAKVNNSKPAYDQDAMERNKLQVTYVQVYTSLHATEMLSRNYSILCRAQTPARESKMFMHLNSTLCISEGIAHYLTQRCWSEDSVA